MSHLPSACVGVIAVMVVSFASADEISWDGQLLKDVYIDETSSTFIVRIPVDGSIRVVSKDEVALTAIEFSDQDEREALKEKWRQNRSESHSDMLQDGPPKPIASISVPLEHEDFDTEQTPNANGSDTQDETPEPIKISSKGNFKPDPLLKAHIAENLAYQKRIGAARDAAKVSARINKAQFYQQALAEADEQRRNSIEVERSTPIIGISKSVSDEDDRMFGYFRADGSYQPGNYVDLGPDWAAYRGRVPQTYP